MRALQIDVINPGVHIVDIVKFTDFYPLLNASCFDIAYRKIGTNGVRYDIYCDDEGWLKDHPIISAVDSNTKPMLVGNLVVARSDEQGEQIYLTDDDINYIYDHLRTATNFYYGTEYPVLIEVNY